MTLAQLPLRICIVGGGLCGLASATALSQAGHAVTVLERKAGLDEIGAGIQIQPNATRILDAWGLSPALRAVAHHAGALTVKRYNTGEVLRTLSIGETRFGYPAWLIYRPDLQSLLLEAAKHSGATMRFGAEVSDIDQEAVRVTCRDGSTMEADLILLADGSIIMSMPVDDYRLTQHLGIGSHLRRLVLGEEVFPSVLCRAYRILIPADKLVQDEVAKELLQSGERYLWVGPGRTAVAYPLSHGRYYNLVLEHPGAGTAGNWNQTVSMQQVREEFRDFDPTVSRILGLADHCIDWTLARLPPLARWTSDSGRMVLIGDSAHATTPQLAQGAGMAIEDAAGLAECLNSVSSKADVALAVSRFVALRKPRVEKVQQASWDIAGIFTLPDGEAQEARDLQWRKSGEDDAKSAKTFLEWLLSYDIAAEARSSQLRASI